MVHYEVEILNARIVRNFVELFRGKIAVAGAYMIFGQIIKITLQLTGTAVLARILAPSDFGLLALATPITIFFTSFANIGLNDAAVQSQSITRKELSTIFWINVSTGVFFAVVIASISGVIAEYFSEERLTNVLIVMGFSFVLAGCLAQYQVMLQRGLRFRSLVVIDLIANVLAVCISIAVALYGGSYWALVIAPIIVQVVSLSILIPISEWQPGIPRWERGAAELLRYGRDIAAFNVLNYFCRNFDNILIGKVWGTESLGYYARAYSLMLAPPSLLITPLGQMAIPVLSQMRDDWKKYLETYKTIMNCMLFLTVPMATTMIIAHDWVIAIFLGPKWTATNPILVALGAAGVVQPLNNSLGWLLMSQGRSRDILKLGITGSILTVASIIAGIPWGATGVAVSYSLIQVVGLTPLLWWITGWRGPIGIPFLFKLVLPFWISCIVAVVLCELLRYYLAEFISELSLFAGLSISLLLVFVVQIGVLLLTPAWRNAARTFLREEHTTIV